jgi:hypothetical protein
VLHVFDLAISFHESGILQGSVGWERVYEDCETAPESLVEQR